MYASTVHGCASETSVNACRPLNAYEGGIHVREEWCSEISTFPLSL